MFLQTVLWHPEGLATFERTIPWADLATFLGQGPRVSSNHTQSEKLSKSGILPGNWAMLGMVWPGQLFEGGFRDGGEGQLMEVEMLDAHNPLPQVLDEDGMWEDDLDANDKLACEKPSWAMLAWRRTMWACMKIAKVVPSSIGMEGGRGGSTEYLQRKRTNGKKVV